ncbi:MULTISPECIES: S-layer homology domain-containing protein [Pontibacillus]|uniref:S-layer homology domain-containing protein n=1 Tax=Pontibacillus chungwhensis TaxID=265426 RepID=A0ABY8UY79_9BACI|nr:MULTISPECIES: S-layer homology domain-containing protein [Pontibacillus]MCD5323973.1 S-layer homology domain-containing protein [Pontibacillus sp. HN14]WIF97962.1 S-layer homology domain-containing protein [Pontibacillus chungwhensis]
MNIKRVVTAGALSASLLIPSSITFADNHGEKVMKPTVQTEAVELRATLDKLFSEHVYLAMTAMRKGANGDPDFEEAAEALNGNTEDLTMAMASVYGVNAGEKFNQLWSDHVGYFVDYVKATAAEDEDAKEEALANLSDYKEEFSTFISNATNGQLKAEALAEGLETHKDQLIRGFNEFVEGDYEAAYETQSEAMEHMYMTSKGLSSAIVNQYPDKFNSTKSVTKAAQLRSDLDFLLSEHFALAQQAMQNGIQGAPEFEANLNTLNANTDELAATIGSVYGDKGEEKFKKLWSSHIQYFVNYVVATGEQDEEARQDALDELDEYREDFSSFMSTATDGGVPADGLAKGLQTHVKQLTGTFDAYVNEDYDKAWEIAREGYGHMFTPAKLFSSAIVKQYPDLFTTEMDGPTVSTPAVELRATLDRLFSEHVYLAMTAMRKGANGDEDFSQAAEALSKNTDDLAMAMTNVYGEDAGEQFKDLWSDHVGYFVDYVTATGEGNEEAKQEALDNLSDYKEEFSQFISTATDGKLKAEGLAEGLETHKDQLIDGFEAFVDGDYEKAYMIQSNAMEHMYMTSKGLSSAIVSQFPEEYNETKAMTPAAELRSRLDFLLSEHFALAQQAMQNGIEGAPEFDANVKTLSMNTEELASAIGSVYGDEAGEQFKDLWSSHIGYFVDYVKATASDDEEAKQKALDELDDYRKDFSLFMDQATDGRVPSAKLAQGLAVHVDQLTKTFDKYVDEDYDAAWRIARSGYGHMFTPAKLFSGAIVNQYPEQFETEDKEPVEEAMFEDVPKDHWAYEPIQALADQGVVKGVDENHFEPAREITRGEFTAILVRSLGFETDMEVPFDDVGDTFADEVAAAYQVGITDGISETKFAPHRSITRQEMAVMLVEAYEAKMGMEYEVTEDYMYDDENEINDYFNHYIDAARELGIMEGYNGNDFDPLANANRGQAAKVVYMLHKQIK